MGPIYSWDKQILASLEDGYRHVVEPEYLDLLYKERQPVVWFLSYILTNNYGNPHDMKNYFETYADYFRDFQDVCKRRNFCLAKGVIENLVLCKPGGVSGREFHEEVEQIKQQGRNILRKVERVNEVVDDINEKVTQILQTL